MIIVLLYTTHMIGFVGDIEKLTLANSNFRQVIYTGQHAQLVLMCLQTNEEIGAEVHEIVDQFLRIEEGTGVVIINGKKFPIKAGSAIIVPAGSTHNVINISPDTQLKLYTVYSPPHHKSGVIHKTKKDAESDTADHL